MISLLLLHETLPSFLIYWHCFLQYFKAKYEKSLINFYDMLNISSVYQALVKRGWELMWALVRLTDNLWSNLMWLLFLFDRGIIELGKLWCKLSLVNPSHHLLSSFDRVLISKSLLLCSLMFDEFQINQSSKSAS